MTTSIVNGLVKVQELRETLKRETRDFRESLPAMPSEVFAELIKRIVTTHPQELDETSPLRNWQDSFRLLSSQKEQIEAARKDHATRINAPEKKAQILAKVTDSAFKTFKVRITSKGEHKFSLTGSLKV